MGMDDFYEFLTTHYALLAAVVVGLFGILFALWFSRKPGYVRSQREGKLEQSVSEESTGEQEEDSGQKHQKQQTRVRGVKPKAVRKITLPSHPLLAGEFKGHTGTILSLDFDINGKYLASCSEDRTLRLWHMKTLQEKDHKYTRKNIELDHATHMKFSPDGTAVVTFLAGTSTIHVFRILKQKGGSISLSDAAVEFPKSNSDAILSLGIASTGKFIMTCTETAFTVWTLKGAVLASVETRQAPNSCAAVSPCGKFVACAGFTPDVKLWEVEYSKTGEFQQVSRAMELKGHRASVLSLAFSGDSHRMVTLSKDGTWKFWDIDVRYHLSEDPKLLQSAGVPEVGHSLVALSPDSRVATVSTNTSLYLYSTSSGECMETLGNVHGDTITDICWDPSSLFLASTGGTDRYIRLWHNAPGQRDLIKDLEAKIPKATSEPLKRRLQQQVEQARERLKSIGQL